MRSLSHVLRNMSHISRRANTEPAQGNKRRVYRWCVILCTPDKCFHGLSFVVSGHRSVTTTSATITTWTFQLPINSIIINIGVYLHHSCYRASHVISADGSGRVQSSMVSPVFIEPGWCRNKRQALTSLDAIVHHTHHTRTTRYNTIWCDTIIYATIYDIRHSIYVIRYTTGRTGPGRGRIRYMIHDTWCMIHDTWHMTHDTWYMIR